jgi:hypothetical protein
VSRKLRKSKKKRNKGIKKGIKGLKGSRNEQMLGEKSHLEGHLVSEQRWDITGASLPKRTKFLNFILRKQHTSQH